jgi:DNA polymerase-3 subunit gamma/tau
MSDSDDIFAASGVDAPVMPAPGGQPYRVLARKYRPSKFSELIGQDAMVQTLANAIKRDRLAHAFLMTGVRGVGKTSTARLIAKGLNCIGVDGQGGPTIDPCGVCDPCRGIAEGRFIDVLEIDAASHTGVDKMRELLDNVPYASVSARYKIYVIDEVHMLSKSSFNALLKTLEEPPEHVKFIFATTEVEKVPITVLSRCQRFDLKRISAEQLTAHFLSIAEAENVVVEADAAALIAQASEGSVRDGLSILDQAIAHADMGADGTDGAAVTAEQVRDMLGLSDRRAIARLFGRLLAGEARAMLDALEEQYRLGVEPKALINGLLSLVHLVTLTKVGGAVDKTLSDEAQKDVLHWAETLSFAQLHRLWQLVLKAFEEVQRAANPREACDMALLRVMHAADMPDPGQLVKLLSEQGGTLAAAGAQAGSAPPAPPTPNASVQASQPDSQPSLPRDFDELVALVGRQSAVLESLLIAEFRLVEFAPPKVIFQPARGVAQDDIDRLCDLLKRQTGVVWTIRTGEGAASPSIQEQRKLAEEAAKAAILESPMVKAAFAAFPDAELIGEVEDEPRSKSA